MTIEQIKAAYESQPFRPFILHIADGRQLPINSREFISPAPTGRTIAVWAQDGACHIIDLLLVTDLEILDTSHTGRRRRA